MFSITKNLANIQLIISGSIYYYTTCTHYLAWENNTARQDILSQKLWNKLMLTFVWCFVEKKQPRYLIEKFIDNICVSIALPSIVMCSCNKCLKPLHRGNRCLKKNLLLLNKQINRKTDHRQNGTFATQAQ